MKFYPAILQAIQSFKITYYYTEKLEELRHNNNFKLIWAPIDLVIVELIVMKKWIN